jgi:hypothetical protein
LLRKSGQFQRSSAAAVAMSGGLGGHDPHLGLSTAGLLLLALAAPCGAPATATAAAWDVVVYGSSPAGVAAATAAGDLGLKVALYEPLPMIGGLGAAGFLALHDGGMNAVSGLALNFTLLNGAYYNTTKPVQQPESFVSNASFYQMLANAGVQHIKLDCRVTAAATTTAAAAEATGDGAAAATSKIDSMTVLCEIDPVVSKVYIDASYDGDLMVAAGNIPFTAGRESIEQYNESLAGARIPGAEKDRGPRDIDPLGPGGRAIKYVQNVSTLPAFGEADDALMAFQVRRRRREQRTFFEPLFCVETISFNLPRQARDKHSENSEKQCRSVPAPALRGR